MGLLCFYVFYTSDLDLGIGSKCAVTFAVYRNFELLIQLPDMKINTVKFIYVAQDAKFNSRRRRADTTGDI